MLGAITNVTHGGEKASAPTFVDQITVVGDNAYPAGGTPGFAALFNAAVKCNRTILSVHDMSPPASVSTASYDVANDKLFIRVRATGAESAVSDQSAVTYRVVVISK
jgi:hypothetical protein